ncbi:MAG: UDP-N-acetylmuramoyl-L-alanyl-D-glutamate--2,6-diaminopimelate ligase [Pseudomonadota bacterium]
MNLDALFSIGLQNRGSEVVTGLTADSRKVRPGFVFAALKGVAADGQAYIPQALENGATAILTDRATDTGSAALILDPEPRLALAKAAARFYPDQPGTMVAITGTNGKSSTVDFLRQIWRHAGLQAASMGTLGAVAPSGAIDLGHTTPDPVAIHHTLHTLAGQGVTHCAMEASSHGLDQYRLDGVRLGAVAFTNFTQDHLDYHPTMAAYRGAKLRLFRALAPPGAPAIINADSPEREPFEEAARTAGLDPFSVGWRGTDLKIAELMPRATGQTLFLNHRSAEKTVDLPLVGEFQALNALTAAGLALALGTPFETVVSALSALEPVKGRLEFVGETTGGAGVFVDYAHTPDGLDVLLRAARPHTAGRLVVVFGCGGDRDRGKRPLMGEIAARQADIAIITDDNPRSEPPATIRAAIRAAAPDALEIGDRGEAIGHAVAMLEPGDTLLIAGKGHETGQIVGDQIIAFSDQDTALAALAARKQRESAP